MAQELSPKRVFYTLDGIRGVAAVLVVLWHTGQWNGLSAYHENYLAVDIFFLLSGVVICHSYEGKLRAGLSTMKFFTIRLTRLYPLYILGTAISVLTILLGFGPGFSRSESCLLIVLGILMLPNPFIGTPSQMFPFNIPAWSLFFEIFNNILYAIILRFLSNRMLVLITAVFAVGAIIFVNILPDHRMNIGFTVRSSPAGFCRCGFSFFAGVFLCRMFIAGHFTALKHTRYDGAVPWLILTIVAIILFSIPPRSHNACYDLVAVILVFPVLVYAGLLFQPVGFSVQIFRFLGIISYPIYAVHDPLFHAVDRFSDHAHFSLAIYKPWTGAIFVVLAVGLSWCLDFFYDAPVRKCITSKVKASVGQVSAAQPMLFRSGKN